ncbi:uncharacterized protein EI90DRAFT_3033924, partial [Cantharellus anzutake]|uniref:uncharacterized protein n=1 Tax=Cantharellus anzutake TaxID=1750568 RepID=UPI001903AB31
MIAGTDTLLRSHTAQASSAVCPPMPRHRAQSPPTPAFPPHVSPLVHMQISILPLPLHEKKTKKQKTRTGSA